MIPGNAGEPLADDDVILRSSDKDYVRANGEIRLQAFLVRNNGKDDDGLSVTQEGGRAADQLHDAINDLPREKIFCCIVVGVVKTVATVSPLNVVADPALRDRFHCLIVNTPKANDDKAYKRRIAELLAERAYGFRPSSRPLGK